MAFTKVVGAGIHTLSNITSHNIHSSGIVTATGLDISGDATIGGVLTYEDVTSIDSVGLITARNGIDCNADLDVDGHTNLDNVSIAGVSTFNGGSTFGSSINLGGELNFTGNGHKYIDVATLNGGNTLTIRHQDGGSYETAAYFDANGGAFLQFNGNTRFQTTNAGATVHGNLTATTGIDCNGDIDVDGNLQIADKITHTSDTNTAIRFPANDTITAETDGSERFRITPTGRIEQSNNNEDIDMDGFANGQLKLDGNGYNAALALNTDGLNIYCNSANRGIIFGTNETERVRITNIGRVGIGTDNPDANLTIHTTTPGENLFNIHADLGSNNNRLLNLYAPASDSSDDPFVFQTGNSIQFKVDSHEGIKVHSNGKVGINSTNPSSPLEIYTAASAAWKFRIDTTVSEGAGFYQRSNGDFELVLRDASNNNNYMVGSGGGLQFVTSGNEKLRITSTGYVGINTTGLYPLDVLEPTNNAGLISITGANTGYDTGFLIRNGSSPKWYLINDVNGSGGHTFEIRGDGWSNDRFLTLTQTGKVGVNQTSPTAQFQVGHPNSTTGVLRADPGYVSIDAGYANGGSTGGVVGSASNAALIFAGDADTGLYHSASDTLNFTTGGTERLRIDSIGRILLGSQRTFGNANYYDDITVNNSNNSSGAAGGTGLTLISGSSSWNAIIFGDNTADVQNAGYIKYSHASDFMQFATSGTERLRISSGGQIGITKTPKEWYTGYRSLQIHDAGYIAGSTDNSFVAIGANNYLDISGTYDYTNSDYASQLYQVDGKLIFRNAASGTADNAITWAERFRITSGGELVFAGDVDTFIDHPNADQIEITAGNIEVATFIDGQSNRPAMLIDKGGVNNTTGGANYNSNANANDLVVGNVSSGNHGITICSASSGTGSVNFSDGSGGGADAYRGSISYEHANALTVVRAKTGKVVLRNDATDTLVATGGKVGINKVNPNNFLHVVGTDYKTLRLENTDSGSDGPYIELYNNSSSPADDDYTGIISFKNRNSADEEITYAQIRSRSTDITDATEDGILSFHTRKNGTFGERIRITSKGDIEFKGTVSSDGLIGEAYGNYFGLKHANMNYGSEYMILSNNEHTFISCTSGYNIYIRPSANSAAHQTIFAHNDTTFLTNVVLDNHTLRRSQHHKGHMEGGYNNIGASSAKSSPIYTIGSDYNPDEESLSNMYGIGFAHRTNASFISNNCTAGWGLYVAADGDARIYLNGSDGRIFASKYGRTSFQSGHLEGAHTNIGSTAAKSNPIYTIGSQYNPNENDLGNMYGVGYANGGHASFLPAGGWGMYVASDGDARIFLDAENSIIKFNGGSGAINFTNGAWSGEFSNGKIQTHGSNMYFQNAGGSWQFRKTNGTAAASIASNGTYSGSDLKFKKDVVTISNAVDTIKKLTGRSFTWKEDDTKSFGVIAQEVETVLPELVSVTEEPEGSEVEPSKMVNYPAFAGHFIEAIKELSAKIETLEQENTTLKARVTNLEGS